jgi:hypothetical protein
MLIQLTAFGGKLKSEVMDMPNMGHDFRLFMDVDLTRLDFTANTDLKQEVIRAVRFVQTGYCHICQDPKFKGLTVWEYRLVDVIITFLKCYRDASINRFDLLTD